MSLDMQYQLAGGYTWASGVLTASEQFASFVQTFTEGTSTNQINFVYKRAVSLATTTYLDIDLKGGGGELDVLNVAMAATAVKGVFLKVTTPASGTSLRLGPQGRTDAAQLWFQAVTANFYDTVSDIFVMSDRGAGWALGASTKVLSLYNPGASTVAATLYVVGTK